jgi:hypothetical protein
MSSCYSVKTALHTHIANSQSWTVFTRNESTVIAARKTQLRQDRSHQFDSAFDTRSFALLDADAVCIFVISKASPEHILRSHFHEMLPFPAPEQPNGFQLSVRTVSFYLCNVI